MSTPETSEAVPARTGLAKPLVGIVLVVVAIGAVAIGVVRESSKSVTDEVVSSPAEQPQVVTVYYFHGDDRCQTCRAIEAATERVVRDRFAEELASGMLLYKAVNFDAPGERHFRDDYDLAFGSVIVQGYGDDHPWKNLTDVWSLIHSDPAEFEAYLVENIVPMLSGNG